MLLFSQLLPLAADLLEVVLPIIFMILYAVSQLLTAKKQAQKEGRPPKLEVPLPEGPQKEFDGRGGLDRRGGRARVAGRDAGQPGGLKGALRKEVDEFLRRAQGNRDLHEERSKPLDDQTLQSKSQSSRQPRSLSGSRKALLRESSSPPQNVRGRPPAKPSLTEAFSKEEDRSTPPPATFARRDATARSFGTQGKSLASDLRSQSVPAHVAAHISHSSQAIVQHAEHLGAALESTSEQTQHRIEQRLDHRVGSLSHQEKAAVAQEPALSEEVADLLRSPEGMRQLIIANEILNRPEY
ncbi:MAG: hypothetical protein ABGX16_25765 [Pirellulales bacterium]